MTSMGTPSNVLTVLRGLALQRRIPSGWAAHGMPPAGEVSPAVKTLETVAPADGAATSNAPVTRTAARPPRWILRCPRRRRRIMLLPLPHSTISRAAPPRSRCPSIAATSGVPPAARCGSGSPGRRRTAVLDPRSGRWQDRAPRIAARASRSTGAAHRGSPRWRRSPTPDGWTSPSPQTEAPLVVRGDVDRDQRRRAAGAAAGCPRAARPAPAVSSLTAAAAVEASRFIVPAPSRRRSLGRSSRLAGCRSVCGRRPSARASR